MTIYEMNVRRTDIAQANGTITVRFNIDMAKRVEIRIFPIAGVYGLAQLSISTATLTAEDMPSYIAMLAMAQAELVLLNTTYAGKEV